MAKTTTRFVCQACGSACPKWMGRCPECGEWNSLVEEVQRAAPTSLAASLARNGGAPTDGPSFSYMGAARSGPRPITEIEPTFRDRATTFIGEFDRVLGGGVVQGSLVLIGGDPGIGKCLAGSERVFDPCSGAYLPITEWARAHRPVLALREADGRLVPSSVSAFHEQGVREVVEVQTRLGRALRCTPSHPVLTPAGWMPVGDLTPGTRLASPRALPFFGTDELDEDVVKLIAYVLSDGSAHSAVTVTSALSEVEEDLRGVAERFGMTLRVYAKPDNRARQFRFVVPCAARKAARQAFADTLTRLRNKKQVAWMALARHVDVPHTRMVMWYNGRSFPSPDERERLAQALGVPAEELVPEATDVASMTTPVARVLEQYGVRFSRASNKMVPEAVFRLPKPQLARFLKILFSCDGSVYLVNGSTPGLSYSTISRRLAQDVQHLLLRFGFVTKLRTKGSLVRGVRYTAYELQMLGAAEVRRFLDEIGIWGREAAKAEIAALALPILPSTNFEPVPVEAGFLPPVRDGLLSGFFPRPEPLFLPPPVDLLTVAQARRSASSFGVPRFS